jgi:hypothetical protein
MTFEENTMTFEENTMTFEENTNESIKNMMFIIESHIKRITELERKVELLQQRNDRL